MKIRVRTAPGMRIETRHSGFEGGGWYLQMLCQLRQRLTVRDPRQARAVARWQATERVGVHQVLIEDQITRDVDEAVLTPCLEGMGMAYLGAALPPRAGFGPCRAWERL